MRRRSGPSSVAGGHPPLGGKITRAPTEPADETREDDPSSKIGRASSLTGREDLASSLGLAERMMDAPLMRGIQSSRCYEADDGPSPPDARSDQIDGCKRTEETKEQTREIEPAGGDEADRCFVHRRLEQTRGPRHESAMPLMSSAGLAREPRTGSAPRLGASAKLSLEGTQKAATEMLRE